MLVCWGLSRAIKQAVTVFTLIKVLVGNFDRLNCVRLKVEPQRVPLLIFSEGSHPSNHEKPGNRNKCAECEKSTPTKRFRHIARRCR